MTCALCGHSPEDEGGGGGAVVYDGPRRVDLCHTDDHSCYIRWTLFGDRPQS